MSVNFDKLPPEEPVPDEPPSRLLWTIVFFVIAIAGVFAVLLLWPKGESMQTPWFWTCVTVYPFGVAAFVVLRRHSVYEGRRLDAIEWNKASADYREEVFEKASIPLAVLAAIYRFSSEEKDDDFGKLMDGSVRLEPQIAPKPDSPSVNARWFEKPDADENKNRFKEDSERQHHVLAWAFATVADGIADAVRTLSPELRLKVQLMLPGTTDTDKALAIWNRQWAKSDFRSAQARVLPETPDLTYADEWLDRLNRSPDKEARLLVGVRLNAIHQALPPDGSAEAVFALLLASEAACQEFNLAPVAMLHRPNGAIDCPIPDALTRALRWGSIERGAVKGIWQSGLAAPAANAASKAVVQAGINAKMASIDYMVGHAGEIAPWLNVVCAAKAAIEDRAPQLVVTTGKTGAYFSVIRNIR